MTFSRVSNFIMKRILFLTLTVAAAALLSGCADLPDNGHGDQDRNNSNQYDHQNFSGGGY